jgi:hypothetical protein
MVDTLLFPKLLSGHHKNPDNNLCYETGPESPGLKNTTKTAQQTEPDFGPETPACKGRPPFPSVHYSPPGSLVMTMSRTVVTLAPRPRCWQPGAGGA